MKSFPFLILLTCGWMLYSSPLTLAVAPSPFNPSPSKQETKAETDDQEVIVFTPPPGWQLADSRALPASVKVMVIGKGKSVFPPSMNLATQPYKGTIKQYLKSVKAINDSQGSEWKDLGTIRTDAGNASLSQVDRKTEWGEERMMHVILLKNETIYILTASALKNEFPQFYKDFFAAMRSLRVNKDIFEMITSSQLRNQLKQTFSTIQSQWTTLLTQKQKDSPDTSLDNLKKVLFESEEFQSKIWTPFNDMIKQKFTDMGPEWQSFVLDKMMNNLFNTIPS